MDTHTCELIHSTTKNTQIAGRSSVNTALIFLILAAAGGLFAEAIVFLKTGFSVYLIATTLSVLIAFGTLFRIFWNSAATAYTKDGMLIVRYVNGKVRITELQHMRMGKVHKYLLFRVSRLRFSLDGRQHKILVFSSQLTFSDNLSTLQKAA